MIAAPTVMPAPQVARHNERPTTLLLGGLVVRRWAASTGTRTRRLVASIVLVIVAIGVLANRLGREWSPPLVDGSGGASAEILLLALSVGVFFGAAAFAIFATASRSVPRTLRLLRTLPVSATVVDRAGALPVLTVGGGLAMALLPTVGAVTTRLTGRGPVPAVLLVGILAVSGFAAGVCVLGTAERVLPWPGGGSLRLTVAYLAWTVVLAVSLAAPSELLRRVDDPNAIVLLAPLGWPMAWWALVDPRPLVVAGAVLTTSGLVWAGRCLSPGSCAVWATAAETRVAPAVRPVAFDRPLPLVRFEARRLVRNVRTLEAVIVSGFCALAVALGAGWAVHRTPTRVDATVIGLLGAQVAAAFAATARGLSDRRRPAEARLGITAEAHVSAMLIGSDALAVIASMPALLSAAAVLPGRVIVVWLAVLPLQVALAILVSELLTPESGNGAAEANTVLAYAALATAVLALLLAQSDAVAIAGGALLTGGSVAASVLLERAHRRPA